MDYVLGATRRRTSKKVSQKVNCYAYAAPRVMEMSVTLHYRAFDYTSALLPYDSISGVPAISSIPVLFICFVSPDLSDCLVVTCLADQYWPFILDPEVIRHRKSAYCQCLYGEDRTTAVQSRTYLIPSVHGPASMTRTIPLA
jgi:hypothetical protein